MSAIEYAVANKDALDIRGHQPVARAIRSSKPAATDPLVQAVEAAVRAGIVVVVSAGNHGKNPDTGLIGYAGIVSPGNAPSAITVGRVEHVRHVSRADDGIATYSSRGPTWYDALRETGRGGAGEPAAGCRGRRTARCSPRIPDLQVTADGGTLLKLSGTSMSAGVATGAVALMIEANQATFTHAADAERHQGHAPVHGDSRRPGRRADAGRGRPQPPGGSPTGDDDRSHRGDTTADVVGASGPVTEIAGVP